jgi:hypothetical protein
MSCSRPLGRIRGAAWLSGFSFGDMEPNEPAAGTDVADDSDPAPAKNARVVFAEPQVVGKLVPIRA